jgi:hypothetical protein
VSGALGIVRARSGRETEGIALLEEAVKSHEHTFGQGVWQSRNVIWLAEALLLAGRSGEARSMVERSLALVREGRHRVCEPWALHLAGEIAARDDDARAADSYREALVLADGLGMQPLAAHCHLGLGKLYRRAGGGSKADEHLATASALFRKMHIQGSLQDAEGVPS